MLEKMIFKVFGSTEQEVRKALSDAGITPLLVEVDCLDAKIVVTCEDRQKDDLAVRIYGVFPGCVYREGEGTLAETVLERLRLYDQTLSVAESLTGGMIASALVDVPGCSECFMEGIVSYSNQAKISRLGVNRATLNTFGAVSKQVACQMASGLLREGVNYAVSTTGIAGPGGGSEEKPVGLVYIGVADEVKCSATECRFEGSREEIRRLSANTALFLLWKRLVKPIDFDSMVIE
ncbi:MAG: nicotinamide-nucleotide amidohydrolase family protein [Clostridia bacterium]|nr:nicotinamide-nucleotide amidohydrolase family protein [Clostridia bacterium]